MQKMIGVVILASFGSALLISCGSDGRWTSADDSAEEIRATQVAFMEQRGYTMATAAPYMPPPPAAITATAEVRAQATVKAFQAAVKAREKARERRRVATVIAKEKLEWEAGREERQERLMRFQAGISSRHCPIPYSVKIVQHVLGVPVIDDETALACAHQIREVSAYLKLSSHPNSALKRDCDLSNVNLGERWKIRPTPVNHHVHTHDEIHEQEELIIKCTPKDVRTGIDVRSTQDMVIFMSEPDEICHSHYHEHASGEASAHPHCHSHEEGVEGEHIHTHDDHKHYERAYVR